jgi:hypothetical protein
MKVKGFFLAEFLATIWPENFAKANLSPEGDGTLTTRKKVTKNSRTKKAKKLKRDFEAAIEELVKFLTEKGRAPTSPNFRYEQLQLMLTGSFDPDYWIECQQASKTIIETTPTFGDFEGIRNYSYPDPANVPTKPLYSDGVVSSGDPAYFGQTQAGQFYDNSLKWARYVFILRNKFRRGDAEPLFITVNGTIMAEADIRPSRAMLSLIIKRYIVPDGSAKLTTLEPPTDKPIQAQYMYQMPSVSGVGWILEWTKKLVYAIRSDDYETANADLTKLVCLVAPMPMMGHKYNNNTDVLTSISNLVVKAYQIKKTKTYHNGTYENTYGQWDWPLQYGSFDLANECAGLGAVPVFGLYDEPPYYFKSIFWYNTQGEYLTLVHAPVEGDYGDYGVPNFYSCIGIVHLKNSAVLFTGRECGGMVDVYRVTLSGCLKIAEFPAPTHYCGAPIIFAARTFANDEDAAYWTLSTDSMYSTKINADDTITDLSGYTIAQIIDQNL